MNSEQNMLWVWFCRKKPLHCGVLIVKNLLNIHISEISANEHIPYSRFNTCEYTGRHPILDLLADKN